jgi:C_GCAxxG_C_C family probable redox protein
MNRSDKAVEIFSNDCNCCQAVLSAFAQERGMDTGLALRIATPFGGGMGHLGEVCGAVTGAFMALGLKYGNPDSNREAKESSYEAVRAFRESFISLHGSLLCRELLGCDIGTPEGMAEAEKRNLFDTLCADLVRDAVKIVEEL